MSSEHAKAAADVFNKCAVFSTNELFDFVENTDTDIIDVLGEKYKSDIVFAEDLEVVETSKGSRLKKTILDFENDSKHALPRFRRQRIHLHPSVI